MGGTKADYGRLFLETIKLSASTFGGGFIIVPLMQRRFVRELGWIEEQEMLDLTAIAQSAPGAIAVNAAIIIGYHLAGIPGALEALLGTVLPPLVIISLFYNAFRSNPYVAMAMTAMLAGVAAVICDVVITMISSIVHEKRVLPLIILIASFVSVFFFHVSVVAVILVCGAAGAASTLLSARRREPRP